MLEERKHITAANYIAPHYVTLPVILYHVSRLMAVKPIPELEKLKPQLIEDAKQALLSSDNFLDQVLLSTSLLRWGASPPDVLYINKVKAYKRWWKTKRGILYRKYGFSSS